MFPTLPELIIKFVSDDDPKVRKASLDILYTILALRPELLNSIEGTIYEVLQNCKSDKNIEVRKSAIESLKFIKPPI